MPLGKKTDRKLFIKQRKYASAVGILIYLSSYNKLYMQFVVHQYERFIHKKEKVIQK